MRSDDAPKAPAAGGWFRTCHRTLPLCTLGRNIVAGSRSPPPDAALEVGDKKVAEEEEVDDDAGSGWDGKYLVQTGFDVPLVGAERRHSGWEAVEKRWGPPPPLPRRDSEREKTPVNGGDGDNDSSAQLQAPPLALPPPRLEPDFRLRLVLKPADATLPPTDPGQPWNTVTGGAWVGKLGRGLVTVRIPLLFFLSLFHPIRWVCHRTQGGGGANGRAMCFQGGCQETLQVPLGNGAPATQVEARFQLRTAEEPPVV